ncbi:MAG: alpha/beta hydrolase [Deltaproteobacteria bacterium]
MATLGAVIATVELLSHPARRLVGLPPPGLNATSVEIGISSGGHIYGWLLPGKPKGGAVLLLHGVWGDRREMVDRAKFLVKRGYGVLLIDLPAHGESFGERITYGAHEAEGVKAALAFLAQHQPGERIGVIGVSLGAASLVLAKPSPAPSAVVLESMFSTIEDAARNRSSVWLGTPGPVLAQLLIEQLAVRLRTSPAQLHPIEEVAALGCPTLIVSGSADRYTTLDETKRIFDSTSAPKELWIVEGAAHVDLHAFAPAVYQARVGAFLDKYLRTPVHTSPSGTSRT